MQPKSDSTIPLFERSRRACDEAEQLRWRAADLAQQADGLRWAPAVERPPARDLIALVFDQTK
jgi:hypothetical protein